MSKAAGLGRGLSALIGEQAPPSDRGGAGVPRGVREMEISRISPNPNQPRTQFTEEAIEELAASISEHGVLQPILLRRQGDRFEIIAGERRWRAAQRARLHAIPAIVRDADDSATAELALIENIQREDLNPLEEAEGYRQLIKRFGHGQETVAKLVHKSRSHVANLLRLLDLPEGVQKSLMQGELSMGHARAVATAPDPEALAQEIVEKGLSVRQAEALAKRERRGDEKASRPTTQTGNAVSADLQALERQLSDLVGLRTRIANKGSAGTVTLHYSSLDQLDMICQRLSGEPI